MTKCEHCGESIKDDTDDNYNSDHSQIKCEACHKWQDAEAALGPGQWGENGASGI